MQELGDPDRDVCARAEGERLDRGRDQREQHDDDGDLGPGLEQGNRAAQGLHPTDVTEHDAGRCERERDHQQRADHRRDEGDALVRLEIPKERDRDGERDQPRRKPDQRPRAGEAPEGLARSQHGFAELQRSIRRDAAEQGDRDRLGIDRDRHEQQTAEDQEHVGEAQQPDQLRLLEEDERRVDVERVVGRWVAHQTPDPDEQQDHERPERAQGQGADVQGRTADRAARCHRELQP